MREEVLFGALRSILQEAPSEARWARLCEQLDLWPPEAMRDVAAPYVRGIISRWQPAQRPWAPARWLRAAAEGADVPQLLIFEALPLWRDAPDEALLARLFAAPALAHLRGLSLATPSEALPGSPLAATLERLELRPTTVPSGAQLLALCEAELPALRSLELSWLPLEASHIEALARNPALGSLDALSMRAATLSSDSLAALGALPALRSLDLSHATLPAGASALLRGRPLERLRLDGCEIGDAGAQALAANPHLTRLVGLSLRDNPLTGRGAAALIGALPALSELELARCPLGPEGAEAFAAWPALSRASRLIWPGAGIGDAGVAALLASPHLPELLALDLSGCGIGPEGARALGASERLGRLVWLSLARNGLGAGASALLGGLPSLRFLDADHCDLGDDWVRALIRSPLGQRLQGARLSGAVKTRRMLKPLEAYMIGRSGWRDAEELS